MIHTIVIPTYRRKDKLIRCLKSVLASSKVLFNIFIYFDNNDEHTYKYFKNGVFKSQLMPKQHRAFGIWNYHLKNCFKTDGFLYLCDDVELYPDALNNLFHAFETKFPDTDGVVTFNQANLPTGSDSAMGLIGRKFAERYPNNQCFCPDYVSFYADSEIGDYAKKLGKFYHCKEAKLTHHHPSIEKSEIDFTHQIVRDKQAIIDKEVNKIRKEKQLLWGETWELVRNEINKDLKKV